MFQTVSRLLKPSRPAGYRPAAPLILINGLAEQPISWYPNREFWQTQFEVHTPGLLVYDGPVLQDRLKSGKGITVEYLTNRLAEFLDNFVQRPPYHLVGSSLGGQICVEYAARHSDKVGRMVLLCPSGMGGEERLPIVEGARHHDYDGLVGSTFYDRSRASRDVVAYYEQKFASRPWRKALFHTVRSTKSHSVREDLLLVKAPTLVVCGENDQIVDPYQIKEAVADLPNFRLEMLPRCGHALQLEIPEIINPMVAEFLSEESPEDTLRESPRAQREARARSRIGQPAFVDG